MPGPLSLRVLTVVLLGGALFQAGQVGAAPTWQTVRASYGGLSLTLRVEVLQNIVVARATLKNVGTQPWQYRGGCVPPEVQVKASTLSGNVVYSWTPTRTRCMAVALLSLAPGHSIKAHARFPITTTVKVWALALGPAATQPLFQTPSVTVAPASSF